MQVARKIPLPRRGLRDTEDRRAFGPPRLRAGLESLGFGNAEVTTDFAREMVVDLGVPWNCTASPGACVVPPRVSRAFAQKFAIQGREMPHQITAFHTAMGSSS